MSAFPALIAFVVAAGLLAIMPGLDTALTLRTAAVDGPRKAVLAVLGIMTGCLIWGAAVAVGLGALLTASQTAFTLLKWCGAAYLLWLGLGLILKPRKSFEIDAAAPTKTRGGAFVRGLLTNLLNPKVGVFYVSFLPQFVPEGAPAGPVIFGLAAAQGLMGTAWLLTLTAATRPIAGLLKRPKVVSWLDRVTGGVFIAFGAKLALSRV